MACNSSANAFALLLWNSRRGGPAKAKTARRSVRRPPVRSGADEPRTSCWVARALSRRGRSGAREWAGLFRCTARPGAKMAPPSAPALGRGFFQWRSPPPHFPHPARNPNGTILLTLEWRRTHSALIDPPMNTANELKRALIGQHKPSARRLVSSVSSWPKLGSKRQWMKIVANFRHVRSRSLPDRG